MANGLAARNNMVDWQVAPGCHEISNYDDVKIEYRESVEEIIRHYKSLKKMTFVTISTNVLCADISTSVTRHRPHVEPIERDIYLPLEISLTKASVSDINKDKEDRTLKTAHWIINPGPPSNGCVNYAKDHKSLHKIDYDKFRPNDTYLESNMLKIVKEINAFLPEERIVYSKDLRHCRQDLGCLKWLNRETDFRMKPVKVFSLVDLYVVLHRQMFPRVDGKDHFCAGIAQLRFAENSDAYDPENQCRYHQDKLKEDDLECTENCALAVARSGANTVLDDLKDNRELEQDRAISNAGATAGH